MVGGWTISGIAKLSEARGPTREQTDSVALLHSKAEHIDDAKRQRLRHYYNIAISFWVI
jgi:hypothetical protein